MAKPADEQQIKQSTRQLKASLDKQAKSSPHNDGKLKDGTHKDGKLRDPERKKKKRSHRSGSKRRKHKGSKRSHKKKHKRRIINIEIIKPPGKPDVVVPPPPPALPQPVPPAPKEAPEPKKEKHSKRKKSKSSSSSSSSSSSEDEKKKTKKKSERKVAPAKEQKSPQPMVIGVMQMPQPDVNRNILMSPVQQNPQVVMVSPAQPMIAVRPQVVAQIASPVISQPQAVPKPPVILAPKPVVPKPADPVAPKPADPAAPKLTDPAAPKPADQVAPKPADPAAQKPADQVAPKPADQVAPKPADPAAQKPANPVVLKPAEPQPKKSPVDESASKMEAENCKPECDCMDCVTKKAKDRSDRAMLNEWTNFKIGAPFPNSKCVQALDRPLNTLPGENPEQFVAMAYIQGEAVMGRVWKDAQGKVAASFCRGGREFKGNIGSIEILLENPDKVRGFDYGWRDYKEAAEISDKKEWKPIHINHVCPCVMTIDGKEVLGKVDVRNERALVGHNGLEKVLLGSAVTTTKVLCRKAKPGYALIE